MKKNLLNEIQDIKFLFGYERGRVLSEQKNLPMDEKEMEDIMMSDTEVMEPEIDTMPDIDMPDIDRKTRPNPFDPSRLPFPDPDTHPQGEDDSEVEFELELDDKHFDGMDEKIYSAEESGDPFNVEPDRNTDSLERMVRRYLKGKK